MTAYVTLTHKINKNNKDIPKYNEDRQNWKKKIRAIYIYIQMKLNWCTGTCEGDVIPG